VALLKADPDPQGHQARGPEAGPQGERLLVKIVWLSWRPAAVQVAVTLGEDDAAPARDVRSDALAVLGDDVGIHWFVLAARH
jgi:hypothetical protein